MRNIIVLQDRIHAFLTECGRPNSLIASISFDKSSSTIFVLFANGMVYLLEVVETSLLLKSSFSLDTTVAANDWIDSSYLPGIGVLVCISRSGHIVLAQEVPSGGLSQELIGSIDGGIACCSWCPDQTCLALLTNNDTILLMSSEWDVLQEVPSTSRIPNSPASVSWRGDGMALSIGSVDSEDEITRIRMYDRELNLTAVGRNVADGAASILKGVGPVVAFATNGTYIAIAQQRVKGVQQVALLERNGLRHGDFNILYPTLPAECKEWSITGLQWDLPSTLLAVELTALPTDPTFPTNATPAAIQIYYRNNYKWYLKQQFTGVNMKLLGFDCETVNRLYFTQGIPVGGNAGEGAYVSTLRIIEFTWDIYSSESSDATVAVVDGSQLLCTSLGYAIVPPPMSKYVTTVATKQRPQRSSNAIHTAVRNVCFWNTISSTNAWNMACLIDDGNAIVFYSGDKQGNPTYFSELHLQDCLPQPSSQEVKDKVYYRSILVTEERDTSDILNIILLGSMVHAVDTTNMQETEETATNCDQLLCLRVQLVPTSGENDSKAMKVLHSVVVRGINGFLNRMHAFHSVSCTDVVVGVMNHVSAVYEVSRFGMQSVYAFPSGAVVQWDEIASRLLSTVPECCYQFAIIHDNTSSTDATAVEAYHEHEHNHQDNHNFIVIALSAKNRLYCGEMLLIMGASSFIYNAAFAILMFITLGTKPHLHFCSYAALHALNPYLSMEEQQLIECAEPRPVERGAKLVAAVANDSKVIIQLPRGNLEGFEPRPLILMRAEKLIQQLQFLECFLLLRKQRVDLNFIVDYDPSLFLNNVYDFAVACSKYPTDLLSLLITSLEPYDSIATKYPLVHHGTPAEREALLNKHNFYGDHKINLICTSVRDALHTLVKEDPSKGNAVIHPLLCSYAKHKPAMLVEALAEIRYGKVITVQGIPSAIKYLAFLADHSLLFDTALGCCDFDLARLIGKQGGQMDPKIYLPLIEKFEKVGKGFEPGAPEYNLMHFQVNLHLKRVDAVLEYGIQLFISCILCGSENSPATAAATSADAATVAGSASTASAAAPLTATSPMFIQLLNAITAWKREIETNDLHLTAITKLNHMLYRSNCKNYTHVVCFNNIASVLSDLCGSYAKKLALKMDFNNAIVASLTMSPCNALEAVRLAKQANNWKLALLLAGRFGRDERYRINTEMDPLKLAQSIVTEFQENLEQSESVGNFSFSTAAVATTAAAGGGGGEASAAAAAAAAAAIPHYVLGNAAGEEGDKVMEAAALCIEYSQDVEGAINMLITGQKWYVALCYCIKFNRKDLLEEMKASFYQAVKEMMADLKAKEANLPSVLAELKEIWQNPEDRIQKISTTDTLLMNELTGEGEEGEGGAGGMAHDDTASEYSAVSMRSNYSYRSDARSIRSGTSTVSVLSTSSAISAASSTVSKTFTITGLEHGLLSRGKITDPQGQGGTYQAEGQKVYKRDSKPRRQKRIARSQAKGSGRDVWGIRHEAALCDELVNNITALHHEQLKRIHEYCITLLVLNSKADLYMVIELHAVLTSYLHALITTEIPKAPEYPKLWLEKRTMTNVIKFQETCPVSAKYVTISHAVMEEWKKNKFLAFSS